MQLCAIHAQQATSVNSRDKVRYVRRATTALQAPVLTWDLVPEAHTQTKKDCTKKFSVNLVQQENIVMVNISVIHRVS